MELLDDLDIQILADLGSPSLAQWNVRKPYAELAKHLGVSQETVRLRVKRAREQGYLPAWRIRFNPRLIGYRPAGADLTVARGIAKATAISQLRLVPGVVLIVDFRDEGMLVVFWYEDDEGLDRTCGRIGSICGAPPRAVWRSGVLEPSVRLRSMDWRILEVMKDDARMPLRHVAASLGFTVRTVQRRLNSMAEGRAIMLEGTPRVSRMAGLVCDFLVSPTDRRRKQAADAEVARVVRRIGMIDTSPENHSLLGVACGNFTEVDEVYAKLQELYGTERIRVGIVREFFPVGEWLAGEIRSRAGSAVPRRSVAGA